MNRHFTRLLLYTVFLCSVLGGVSVSPKALGQSDVTGNGTPEFFFVQPLNDGKLQWFAQDLIEGKTTDLGVFGQQGWVTFVAPWEAPDNVTRTTLRRTELGQLFLSIPERQEEVSLGKWPGRVVVNAGRDSNGNGTADALLVVERGKKLSWRFLFDPFTLQGSFKRILFGKPGNIPFLFRARGSSDALAVIVRNQIVYRGLQSSLKRKIRLSDYFPATVPRTVRGSDGRDTLLFASENSEGLLITTFKGKKKSEQQLYGTGTLFIGDVNGSGEETYGVLKNTGELALVSGETFEMVVAGAAVVGSNFQKSYQPEDISATPLPQPTSGFGVTIIGAGTETPGTPVNTSTPIPTFTLLPTTTPVATLENSPTATPTVAPIATNTSTNTPTFTNTPTQTPTNTSTANPTFTDTPLPTPNSSQYLIFVSSAQYGANLGGLRGADETCQGLAATAGLAGSFLSVLSDSTTDAASRFTINAPIYNTFGQQVASNSANLWSGSLLNAVRYDESGNVVTSRVWTGSDES